ncbi:hypothetical protein SAMN05421812_102569 [Asanoa hainanensis]|uniref:Uncharacterized protein n=1 Tax=Asanoa hainanensis TaxID=560556 RepID=A0A239IXL9_9ACTN|nr:hypothetical protein [Asanoa hainanensis]SNS97154.1 hypothetical protein SAMN05421812_102569 [Asanoa hainanensis]
MSFIRFHLSDLGTARFEVEDQRYRALGAWAIIDISLMMGVCLDALAMVYDVAAGRPVDPWSSEHYDLTLTQQGVTFSNYWADEERGRYTLAEFREVVELYWVFLASRPESSAIVRDFWPDLPRPQAEVLLWEQTWERPHPYRGRLF